MTDLWQKLKATKKPIFIYGMGNGADLVIEKLSSCGAEISGVFASDDFVRGQTFHEFKVRTYSDIKKEHKEFIVVTAFGSPLPEIRNRIKEIAAEQELYIADAPVYGKTFFDANFVSVHKNELLEVYNSLSDTRSREVFENIVKFKLSGNPDTLFSTEDDEERTIRELFAISENATIFDLGAFIGDTAEKFSALWPNYEKIIAVEPSFKNYSRLTDFCEKQRNIISVNAAISYLNGNIFFDNEGGRNQKAHSGNHITPCITIDELSKRYGAPDFIKFDIEGEELNGIIGGEQTIKDRKPALLISAYHRSEDLISIPKKILSLRSDYKVYIRRFPCIPCWDTYFMFI